MYIAPIVRARPAPPAPLRLLVGTPVLLLVAVVMLHWMALIALATTLVLGVKLLANAPRVVAQAIDYAGRTTLRG